MTKTYKFSVRTNKVGSDCSDNVDIELPDDASPEEIEEIVEAEFRTWVWENIDSYFEEV
jgi:hypothetical protein